MKYLFSFLAISSLISACSVYQSDGRKFLEKQAYEYAGVEAHLMGCQASAGATGTKLIQADGRAEIYSLDDQPLQIRVIPVEMEKPRAFSCDYGFTTTDELNSKLTGAIEYTLHQMSK